MADAETSGGMTEGLQASCEQASVDELGEGRLDGPASPRTAALALTEAVSSMVERVTSLILPTLEVSVPGPRQRAAAVSKVEVDSILGSAGELGREDVAGGCQFLSSVLAEIADGRRPADEAHVDLALRLVAALGRLASAESPAELEIEAGRGRALMEEAEELARAFLDDDLDDLEMDAELAAIFADEARRHVERARQAMSALSANRENEEPLRDLFRAMHTLKGGAATVGEPSLTERAHALEDLLSAAIAGDVPIDDDLLELTAGGLEEVAGEVDRLGLGCGQEAAPEAQRPAPCEEAEAPLAVRVRVDHLESLLFDSAELGSVRAKAAKAASRLMQLTRRARGHRVDLSGRTDVFVSDHAHPLPRRAFFSDQEMERERVRAMNAALACAQEITELDRDLTQAMDAVQWLARDLAADIERVGGLAARMRSTVTEMRFVPMTGLLERYVSPAVEWAEQAGRLAEVIVEAQGVQVDRGVAEGLAGPLVQLLRNAVAHGIETPKEREEQGKPRCGRIVLRAVEDGADLILEVEDDGRGMEPHDLRRAAVEKGLLSYDEALAVPDLRLPDLIFLPGFSTKPKADSLSGRGVGLDIVTTAVSRMGGVVSVSSQPGRGTRFSARMTPSASTLPVLCVRSGRHCLAIPLAAVRETLLIEREEASSSLRREWRGQELPSLKLEEVLEEPGVRTGSRSRPAVVLGHGDRHALLIVDGLLGREEGIPRPLGPMLDALPLYSGAVVGGDGRVKLVLDASYLLSVALGLRPSARSYSLSR